MKEDPSVERLYEQGIPCWRCGSMHHRWLDLNDFTPLHAFTCDSCGAEADLRISVHGPEYTEVEVIPRLP
jgi:hypothetical protein